MHVGQDGRVATSYRFEERWLLPIDRQATYDVLADLEHYPEWWPQIKAVAKLVRTTRSSCVARCSR